MITWCKWMCLKRRERDATYIPSTHSLFSLSIINFILNFCLKQLSPLHDSQQKQWNFLPASPETFFTFLKKFLDFLNFLILKINIFNFFEKRQYQWHSMNEGWKTRSIYLLLKSIQSDFPRKKESTYTIHVC